MNKIRESFSILPAEGRCRLGKRPIAVIHSVRHLSNDLMPEKIGQAVTFNVEQSPSRCKLSIPNSGFIYDLRALSRESVMVQPPQSNPAEAYEQYFVPAMFRPWACILLRHATPQAGQSMLDIACGTGIVAREAAPLVGTTGQVVALDINSAMLAVAQTLPAPSGAAIQWRQVNAMTLPFAEGSFDLALCQHGLQFFPDRAGAVREMHRVLKVGGRAAVVVLQALAQHPVFEALMKSVASHLALPVSAVAIPFSLSDAEELRTLFLSAGFKTVAVVPETTMVRFPDLERFVPLAVTSSAAAVPAFAQLEAAGRTSLLQAVRAEIDSTIQKYRDGSGVMFPMFAHVAIAEK